MLLIAIIKDFISKSINMFLLELFYQFIFKLLAIKNEIND